MQFAIIQMANIIVYWETIKGTFVKIPFFIIARRGRHYVVESISAILSTPEALVVISPSRLQFFFIESVAQHLDYKLKLSCT